MDDYRCTPEQINAMVRDSKVKTQDMNIIENMPTSVLNIDSLINPQLFLLFCLPSFFSANRLPQ